MSWSLPVSVEIDGKVYNISKKCDYRLVLDILEILSDNDFSEKSRNLYALQNFYALPNHTKYLFPGLL